MHLKMLSIFLVLINIAFSSAFAGGTRCDLKLEIPLKVRVYQENQSMDGDLYTTLWTKSNFTVSRVNNYRSFINKKSVKKFDLAFGNESIVYFDGRFNDCTSTLRHIQFYLKPSDVVNMVLSSFENESAKQEFENKFPNLEEKVLDNFRNIGRGLRNYLHLNYTTNKNTSTMEGVRKYTVVVPAQLDRASNIDISKLFIEITYAKKPSKCKSK